MRDGKLVGSRQRSLSSRFILPRRERPLLAGKSLVCQGVKKIDKLEFFCKLYRNFRKVSKRNYFTSHSKRNYSSNFKILGALIVGAPLWPQ